MISVDVKYHERFISGEMNSGDPRSQEVGEEGNNTELYVRYTVTTKIMRLTLSCIGDSFILTRRDNVTTRLFSSLSPSLTRGKKGRGGSKRRPGRESRLFLAHFPLPSQGFVPFYSFTYVHHVISCGMLPPLGFPQHNEE